MFKSLQTAACLLKRLRSTSWLGRHFHDTCIVWRDRCPQHHCFPPLCRERRRWRRGVALAGRRLRWEPALCQGAGTPARCQAPAAAGRALVVAGREGTTRRPLHRSLLSGLPLRRGGSATPRVANSQEALQYGYSSLWLQTVGNQFSLFIS